MSGSQRMLIFIVAGVILLVIVAFAAVLLRPPPAYTDEQTPEGVVHNYLLALQQGDYEQALTYLAPEAKVGDLVDFIEAVESDSWRFELGGNVSLSVVGSRLAGDDAARVEVQKTVSYNELLGSSQNTHSFDMFLRRVDSQWYLVGGEAYWDGCWDKNAECQKGPQTFLGPRPAAAGSAGP